MYFYVNKSFRYFLQHCRDHWIHKQLLFYSSRTGPPRLTFRLCVNWTELGLDFLTGTSFVYFLPVLELLGNRTAHIIYTHCNYSHIHTFPFLSCYHGLRCQFALELSRMLSNIYDTRIIWYLCIDGCERAVIQKYQRSECLFSAASHRCRSPPRRLRVFFILCPHRMSYRKKNNLCVMWEFFFHSIASNYD